MRSFASDNNSGVHPNIIKAIVEANQNHALGYGADPWTKAAISALKKEFGNQCEPFFVFNGTGSNTMALQILTRPYHIIFCADTAHIALDECGAPSKATGCFIRTVASANGKLTPNLLMPYMKDFNIEHHSQPGTVYISQCTELGTIYSPEELKTLTEFAHQYGMTVHMDGARISNAAAALELNLCEISSQCGIDSLSMGGTKNGLMGAECVIIFNRNYQREARFYRKQTCQLASKMRFLSCQFSAFLKDELWRTCAIQANKMAQKLYEELLKIPYVTFTQPVESNQLFLIMPKKIEEKVQKTFPFYIMNEHTNEMRLVTSFDTTEEDVDALIKCIQSQSI